MTTSLDDLVAASQIGEELINNINYGSEKSIDNLLRTDGILNDENVLFGTGNNNQNYETTDNTDISYTN